MSTGATTKWNIPLFGDTDAVAPIQTPLNSQANALDTALTNAINAGGFMGPFPSLATLNLPANAGTVVGQHASVNGDSTARNNGDYRWNGTVWVPAIPPNYYFRYHKASAFNWTNSIQTLQWDTLADGALTGMTLASGVFTCQTPGLWEFDGRIGITTGSSSANVRWYRNGSPDIEFANGQITTGFVSAGGVYRRVLAAGDTVAMNFITATTSATGITVDGGTNQVTWLSGRYLGVA